MVWRRATWPLSTLLRCFDEASTFLFPEGRGQPLPANGCATGTTGGRGRGQSATSWGRSHLAKAART
jgi:hypothetical protein